MHERVKKLEQLSLDDAVFPDHHDFVRTLRLNHRQMLLEVGGPHSPHTYYRVGEPTSP